MGRGKEKLNFLRDPLPNQRLPVEIRPVEFGIITPMVKNGKFMCKYVSHLSQDDNRLPLTVHDWKYMTSEFIENCILEVKQIFDVPEELNDWVKLKFNERRRNHKHTVKRDAYKKRPTNLEQSLANLLKKMCEKNKEKKIKQKNLHTTGSKPRAKYAVELAKALGRRPKRHEIFGVTHTRKRKTADPNEVLVDTEVDAEIDQASQPGSHIVLQGQNDSFARIKGRDKGGRVRCLGNAVEPKKHWGWGIIISGNQ
ncbi:hypothetical protein MKX01_032312 [Papaver californicum]|nr:hypothetical protein MKX01_032312 [Papaver californicum]